MVDEEINPDVKAIKDKHCWFSWLDCSAAEHQADLDEADKKVRDQCVFRILYSTRAGNTPQEVTAAQIACKEEEAQRKAAE